MNTALLTLAVAVTIAAPVPKEGKKELYFPTTVGSKKVMELKGNGRSFESTETVTKVEEKGGVYTVTLEQDVGGRARTTQVTQVSPKGVFRLTGMGAQGDSPQPMLKLDAKAGDTWTTDLPKATYTMGKEEEVEVPAGKYKALRVVIEYDRGGAPQQKTTQWFAPGVGIVKQLINTGGTDRVTELKSFTSGKGEPKKDK